MEHFTVVFALTFGLLACFMVYANADKMHMKVKCLDKELDVQDCFQGRMECAADFLSADEIKTFKDPSVPMEKKKEIGMKAHKNLCIMVCQWKKHLKILNEDGSFNQAEADKIIDDKFPEAARAALKSGVAKCHADNSKDLKDDNQCESYKPLEECMKKTFAEVCKIDPKDFHMDAWGKQ